MSKTITNRITMIASVVGTAALLLSATPAHAAKNTGRFQTSAEAQHKQQCDTLWNEFTDAVNNAKAAYDAHNTAEFSKWMDAARADVQLIADAGCGTASMPTYPTQPIRTVTDTAQVTLRAG